MKDENEVYFGKVKWFGNKRTGNDYGFIEVADVGDVFVHKSQIISGELDEGVLVSLKIRKSKKDEKKYEATDVENISTSQNIAKLFRLLDLSANKLSFQSVVLKSIRNYTNQSDNNLIPYSEETIHLLYLELIKAFEELNSLKVIDTKFLENVDASINRYFNLPSNKEYQKLSNTNAELLIKVLQRLDERFLFACWLLGFPITIQESKIKSHYLECSDSIQFNYLFRLPEEFIKEIFAVDLSLIQNRDLNAVESLVNKFTTLKSHNVVLYEELITELVKMIDPRIKYSLWRTKIFIKYDEQIEDYIVNNIASIPIEQFKELFSALDNTLLIQILNKVIESLETINLSNKELYLIEIFNYLLNEKENDNDELRLRIISILSSKTKVKYWLDEKIEIQDYSIVLETLIDLNNEDQILASKKLFEILRNKNIKLSEKDCNIVLNNNALNKYDLSVLIVFYILRATIQKARFTYRDIIIFILQKLVKGSAPNFESNYFDRCKGRANIIEQKENNNTLYSVYKSTSIPQGIVFCEGRKAKNKLDKSSVLENGKEFYWCRNKPCFQNDIILTDNKHWRKYSLFDVLHFHARMDEDSYSFILGVLNKFYNYLSHLKCRSCEAWLTPVTNSNYALERINNFNCADAKCSEFNKKIYISHCLNSKCDDIIDSRDSKQCSHGWYICDYCLACCEEKRLLNRKYVTEKMGGRYLGPEQGHHETNQIFCFMCGKEMGIFGSEINEDTYQKCLKWLDEKKDDKDRVVKYGKTKMGKSWFLIKRITDETPEKFTKIVGRLREAGLVVKESFGKSQYQTDDRYYLVSERNNSKSITLKCTDELCHLELNLDDILKDDRERVRAMTYHNKISEVYDSILYKQGN